MNSQIGAPPRAEQTMTDGWEVLSLAIPRGEAGEIAALLNVSEDAVHRWMRRPLVTDDPNATGRRNPIDYFLRLLNAVYLRNPEGAELIADRIVSELARLKRIHGHADTIPVDQIEGRLRQIAREAGRMADAIAGVRGNERV